MKWLLKQRSLWKKKLDNEVVTLTKDPLTYEKGKLILELEGILDLSCGSFFLCVDQNTYLGWLLSSGKKKSDKKSMLLIQSPKHVY
jgi:hypothetical protein